MTPPHIGIGALAGLTGGPATYGHRLVCGLVGVMDRRRSPREFASKLAPDVDDDIASRAVRDRCFGDALRAFLSRLAALISAPRLNLVTDHRLLAPAASCRDRVLPTTEEEVGESCVKSGTATKCEMSSTSGPFPDFIEHRIDVWSKGTDRAHRHVDPVHSGEEPSDIDP